MAYKAYDRQMMANFTGRPVASFPNNYVSMSAIPQALLLFKLGTCLSAPDDLTVDQQQLVDFAVLSMADAIHLSAPYQTAVASPFSSESIGSYSYSKTAKAIQSGQETGILWFDLALDQLSVCEGAESSFLQGGIEIFENDGTYVQGASGNVRFLSPKDIRMSRTLGFDPAPSWNQPAPLPVGSAPLGDIDGGSFEVEPFDHIDGGSF